MWSQNVATSNTSMVVVDCYEKMKSLNNGTYITYTEIVCVVCVCVYVSVCVCVCVCVGGGGGGGGG